MLVYKALVIIGMYVIAIATIKLGTDALKGRVPDWAGVMITVLLAFVLSGIYLSLAQMAH